MAAVTQRVNNFLGGVSRQPDDRKLPGQVREALNAYPDPTFGLLKRPGFKFLRTLKNNSNTNFNASTNELDSSHWFYIARDDDEKYIGCITGNSTVADRDIHIWNGTVKNGNVNDSALTLNAGGSGYTASENVETTHATGTGLVINTTVNTGALTAATVVKGGTGYKVNDIVDVAGGTGGKFKITAVSDDVYTKCDVTLQATQLTVTEDGGGSGTNGSYTNKAVASTKRSDGTTGAGTNMKVNLTIAGNKCTAVTIHTEGSGYKVGDTITIAKANAGNTTNDIVATITAINSKEYLDQISSDNYHVLTVQDTSIITNKKKKIDLLLKPNYTENARATIRLHAVEYSSEYDVKINGSAILNGSSASPTYNSYASDAFNSADTTAALNAKTILTALKTRIDAWVSATGSVNMDVTLLGSTLELHRHDGTAAKNDVAITSIETKGGKDSTKLSSFLTSIDATAGLPAESVQGRLVKIQNTSANADTYWAKFIADDGVSGSGFWEECISPLVEKGLDSSTMSHELYNDSVDSFTFRPITWTERLVGDNVTNEHPSFVSKVIEQSFFYNNRLGFLTEDNVSMSKSGEFFNMYHLTAQTITDSDPIDISCSSVRPAKLHGIIPTPQGLILFSQNQQFIMFSDEGNMTPNNAVINGISNYEMDIKIDPVEVGSAVTFISKTPAYSRVFSMLTRGLSEAPQVSDIGKIVADYIPSSIDYLVASPQNSFVALYGKADDKVYLYRTHEEGGKTALQTWFKWQLPGNVINIVVDSDVLYATIKTANTYELISANLTSTPDEVVIVNTEGESVNPYMDLYSPASEVVERPVDGFEITAAGSSGYTNSDAVSLSGAGGTGFAGTLVTSGGKITGLTITNPGKNYNVGTHTATIGGSGSGGSMKLKVVKASYCYLPYKDVTALNPIILISGSGIDDSGQSFKPTRSTASAVGDYFRIGNRQLASQASKVIVGYSFKYDIELPKIYYQLSPEQTDFTANLTISRLKFSVGLSSFIGFKVTRKGFRGSQNNFTGDGAKKNFPITFNIDSADHIAVTINNSTTTDYTVTTGLIGTAAITFNTAPSTGDVIKVFEDKWYNIESVVKADAYTADDVALAKQTLFTIPVHQRTENYTLRIFSDEPYPVSLTSMMWEGNYSPRYYRRT